MRQNFIDAVKNGEVKSVRMMLSNELLLDPRGKTFSEMLQYAKDKLPNLFEENKPLDFEILEDKSQWDDDFMFKVKKDLNNNFSYEKLGLFEAVAMEVGKKKAQEIEKEETSSTTFQPHQESSHNPKTTTTGASQRKVLVDKKTASVITVSGAILAIIGVGIGKTLLTLAGGTIVVGGIVLLTVADKQK